MRIKIKVKSRRNIGLSQHACMLVRHARRQFRGQSSLRACVASAAELLAANRAAEVEGGGSQRVAQIWQARCRRGEPWLFLCFAPSCNPRRRPTTGTHCYLSGPATREELASHGACHQGIGMALSTRSWKNAPSWRVQSAPRARCNSSWGRKLAMWRWPKGQSSTLGRRWRKKFGN